MNTQQRHRLAIASVSSGPDIDNADSSADLASPNFEGSRYVIEDVYPALDGGLFPIKRIAGEPVEVWADVFRDGHEVSATSLLWSRAGEAKWRREPMRHAENDRWVGSFVPTEPGRYVFAVEAWTDHFATWRRDFLLKQAVGQ